MAQRQSSRRRPAQRVSRLTEVPAGRMVDLPGRGRTYLVDLPGPAGAPTLILLHGLVATGMLNWFPALDELAGLYRVVLFDQRWHGRGIRSERFDLDDLADDVVAVSDLIGVERPILAGYSMGGIVAQLVAHRDPERVGGLVLCATTYRFREKWRERAFHGSLAALADAGMSGLAGRSVQRAARRLPELPEVTWAAGRPDRWARGEMRGLSGWAMAQALAELGRFDSSPWLASLKAPTAVVTTCRDRALPAFRQLEMAKMIPGAEIFLARTGRAGCVLGADVFVPVLLEACAAVAARQ